MNTIKFNHKTKFYPILNFQKFVDPREFEINQPFLTARLDLMRTPLTLHLVSNSSPEI